ncbi:MAG: ParB/RepB/Spo0J family partition protein [Firmicutes bacterium]|nr:ParB/RepB/Spo0J family partition protein [Bacillota bacterium]
MLEMLGKKTGRFSGALRNVPPSIPRPQEREEDLTSLKQEVIEIPLQMIFLNPEQPRKIFREEELTQLASSIRDYGVLQPILVKPTAEGSFMVIAGERRYRAACQAGLFTIPAIVRSMEEEEAALVALVENVQRENLGYLEEARAYKKLMDDFGLTQSEIAQKVGKQQSTISNKIRILSLPDDIQEVLTEHRLTERHARALLRVQGENDRRKVIARVIKNNLNVKQTEKLVDDLLSGQEELRRKKNKVNYISYKIYVNTIRKAFSQIKEMEENAIFTQEDKGDVLELKITIPKKDRCFT